MHQIRDSYHYARLLRSSSDLQTLKTIHTQILTSGLHQNPFLAANLISKYTQQNSSHITDARKVFDNLPHRDAILYNVLIRGYAASRVPSEATSIYAEMLCGGAIRPNLYSYSFALKACAACGCRKTGGAIHAHAVRAWAGGDLFVNNALIVLYAKCGRVETAQMVFDRMPERDLVSWNSVISGCTQNGYYREALGILHRMLPEYLPDHITVVSVLPACAMLAAVAEGMWIHTYALKRNIAVNAAVGSGLIEMYANCGRLRSARKVFDGITVKNVVVYSAMMRAYGAHGCGLAALELFSEMLSGGTEPDSICFVSILSACSHAGLVKEGVEIFDMMEAEYGVEKIQVHYACIVDLLGRAGEFNRALEFIERMPFEPGRDVFGALLGACKAYKNVEIGVEIAKRLLVVDAENAGRYAALAKFYEGSGRWEDAASVRKAMKARGVRKQLGCSMVEVAKKLHTFGVEDETHPMSCEIFDLVEMLQRIVDEEQEAFVVQIN